MEKNCTYRDKKNKYSNSRVVQKKNSERKKKTLKWSVPK